MKTPRFISIVQIRTNNIYMYIATVFLIVKYWNVFSICQVFDYSSNIRASNFKDNLLLCKSYYLQTEYWRGKVKKNVGQGFI